MDNIWFYSLSTSAQVLAALSGLFAVFAVWKIQEFSKLISESRFALVKMISRIIKAKDYSSKDDVQNLHFLSDEAILFRFSAMLKEKEDGGVLLGEQSLVGDETLITYSFSGFTKLFFETQLQNKNYILAYLRCILILNFITIAICITCLTLSALIYAKFLFLLLISLLVLVCLLALGVGTYRIIAK